LTDSSRDPHAGKSAASQSANEEAPSSQRGDEEVRGCPLKRTPSLDLDFFFKSSVVEKQMVTKRSSCPLDTSIVCNNVWEGTTALSGRAILLRSEARERSARLIYRRIIEQECLFT